VRKTVAAVHQRHLQPYQAKNFKDICCVPADVHGPDHATPVGATPLMLAAMAGNAPLVQALLAKGADPAARRLRPHRLGPCRRPRDARARLRGSGLPAVFDAAGPRGAGRADRRPPRAAGTAPGRVLAADADAGRA
jgi:hypothetical protein